MVGLARPRRVGGTSRGPAQSTPPHPNGTGRSRETDVSAPSRGRPPPTRRDAGHDTTPTRCRLPRQGPTRRHSRVWSASVGTCARRPYELLPSRRAPNPRPSRYHAMRPLVFPRRVACRQHHGKDAGLRHADGGLTERRRHLSKDGYDYAQSYERHKLPTERRRHPCPRSARSTTATTPTRS